MGVSKYNITMLCNWIRRNYFDAIFNIIFWTSFILVLLMVSITFLELRKYDFAWPSKESITLFLTSFDWCKGYISSFIVLYTIYYALKTYKISNENKQFSTIIEPQISLFYSRINPIKDTNLRMYHYFNHYGSYIITEILKDNDGQLIGTKEQLTKYFDCYIKQHIPIFEMCEYARHRCTLENCNRLECQYNITYVTQKTHAFSTFKTIAPELLCISQKYTNFENDISDLYISSVAEFNNAKHSN